MEHCMHHEYAIRFCNVFFAVTAYWSCFTAETKNVPYNLDKEKILLSAALPADHCIILFTTSGGGCELMDAAFRQAWPIRVCKLPILADGAPDWRKGKIITFLPQAHPIVDPAITICVNNSEVTCVYITAWDSGLCISTKTFSLQDEWPEQELVKTPNGLVIQDFVKTPDGRVIQGSVKTPDGHVILLGVPETVPTTINGKYEHIDRPIAVVRNSPQNTMIIVKTKTANIISISTDNGGKTWTGSEVDDTKKEMKRVQP